MTNRSVGINTQNADNWVAAITAAEEADGHTRLIQLISVVAGKIDESIGSPARTVASNDSLDITTVSGNVLVGDSSYMSMYIQHSQEDGSCLVTPLLCDNDGVTIGCLDSKVSRVSAPLKTGSYYLSSHLSWDIRETGAYKCFPHIYNLSSSNIIKCWIFLI